MIKKLRIATRSSLLALWQAEFIKKQLALMYPTLEIELVTMLSKGDRILDAPLAKIGGKGLFVKELENALLEDRADIAVHSMKDVPMTFPTGLGLPVICERASPFDALVSNDYESLDALPQGAVLGTSSLRRQCQLLKIRPDLSVQFLRGNINTRLRKLDEGNYQAIVLACAGLLRLKMQDRIRQILPEQQCLPAVGQGALGIECRMDDLVTIDLLKPLNHEPTAVCVKAERALNRRLNGGCQVPIAGFAKLKGVDRLTLQARVGCPETGLLLKEQGEFSLAQSEQGAIEMADKLLAKGADKILERIYKG